MLAYYLRDKDKKKQEIAKSIKKNNCQNFILLIMLDNRFTEFITKSW